MLHNPQSNNGMHPTADTHDVIYFQCLGAAGDAWRYAASLGERTWLEVYDDTDFDC